MQLDSRHVMICDLSQKGRGANCPLPFRERDRVRVENREDVKARQVLTLSQIVTGVFRFDAHFDSRSRIVIWGNLIRLGPQGLTHHHGAHWNLNALAAPS